MKNLWFVLALCCLLIGCNKSDIAPNSNISSYDFSDLLPNENLIDSIIIFHKIGPPGIYKFYYTNKTTIKAIYRNDYINTYRGSDTLFYNGKLDSVRSVGESALSPGLFATTTTKYQYSTGLISRAYNYNDDYYIPILRQLGSYINYAGNYPSLVQFKYMSQGNRDSIKILVKRKLNGDIDSVINQQSSYPGSQNGLVLTFEYGTTANKLNTNANLKQLRYSYYYHPIEFDFTSIDSYQSTLLDYDFMNDIFYDILFSNNILPIKFYYYRSPYGAIPFYIKYKFNSNNYVTSISIGSSQGFDPVINERIQIKYH